MSYIGNEPIVSATRTVTEVTATAGQTLFTANGGYTVGFLDVFINGSKLTSADFTATDGSTVTLTEAAQVNDIVRLEALGTFLASNGVSKTGDTMTGQLTLQRAGGSAGSGNNLYVNVTSSYGGISVNSTANNNSFVELLEAGTKVGGFNADTTNNVTSLQSDGGHALGFNTGGTTERMRLDTSGRLTIPNQPAFHAERNTAFNSGSGVIVFTGVATNIGSSYNSSNGRFTAPVAGTYILLVSFFTNITNAPIDFRITVNGGVVGGNATTGTTSIARDCHAYVIRTLAVNDYVEVQAAGYGVNIPADLGIFQTFSGHLIG